MKFEDYQKSLRQKNSHTDKTETVQSEQNETRQEKNVNKHTNIFSPPIPYQILVTATMSAGKSTLINAMIGRNICKSQNLACTSQLHYIINKPLDTALTSEYGDIPITIEKENLDSQEIDITYASYNGRLSEQRIVICDSPGVNYSGEIKHKQITDQMISSESYQMIIYLMNATQLGTTDDEAHLATIQKLDRKKTILFVMNKIDLFNDEDGDIESIILKQAKYLESKGFHNPLICPVSAKAGFLSKKAQQEELSKLERRELNCLEDKLEKMKVTEYYAKYFPYIKIEDHTDEDQQLLKICGLSYIEEIIRTVKNFSTKKERKKKQSKRKIPSTAKIKQKETKTKSSVKPIVTEEEPVMTQVYVKYNPYRLLTFIKINDKEVKSDSTLYKMINGKRLQEWISLFPRKLANEVIDVNFEITFCGMELDFEDFKEAFTTAQNEKILTVAQMYYVAGKNESDIVKKLNDIFQDLQNGPIDDFRNEKFKGAFDSVNNAIFPINVIATMSSGKSTLINALLGRKLMPSRNEACTATITEILDNGEDCFTASVYDRDGNKIRVIDHLSFDDMNKLNEDANVSKISAEGNIPFLDKNDIALMLVDTPGPNNSQNQEHHYITEHLINNDENSLILYVLNGTQLSTNDDASLLKKVVAKIKNGGKQVRDRFLFVVNKMDCFNPEEENIEKVIESAKRYLSKHGIEDPQIFPCSAYTALNIRTCLENVDIEHLTRAQERQLSLAARDTLPMIDKFTAYESMYLERYTMQSSKERQKLLQQLEQAQIEGNIKKQALIHCGIYSIETAIKVYVKKYAKTKKIKDLVETVRAVLVNNQTMIRSKEQFAEEASKVFAQRRAIIMEMGQNIMAAMKFPDEINLINPIEAIEDKLEELRMQIAKQASNAFVYCGDTIYNKEDAGKVINYFAMLSLECMNKITDEIREFIYHELVEKSGEILSYYWEILKKIGEDVTEIPLYFCSEKEIERDLKNMVHDAEKWSSYAFVIHTIDEIGIVEQKHRTYYEKIGEANYIEKTETIEKFSIDTLKLHKRLIAVFNEMFDKYIAALCFNVENELQNMQNQFAISIQNVINFSKQKIEELGQCDIDCSRMDEELEKNRALSNWIVSRINALDEILEI